MVNYNKEIIDRLNKYNKIVVSGSQRSGTRFVTNAIANDLNYKVVDEVDYEISDMGRFKKYLHNNEKVVIQAPALSNHLHTIDSDNTIVIFLHRNIEDIIKSQKNSNAGSRSWFTVHESVLKRKTKQIFKADKKINWSKNIAYVENEIWNKLQKPNMKVDCLDLKYESFHNHPMFIVKPKRKEFKIDQIK